ncbi:MAG: flippase-like domain-containing protein [Candidatus Riflebacteria bacterium]|nr:flippase-like domain-containing protein [Candidatus Riflebacteria bacterium]MBR4571531.1 flippase-like domain-containing protein [Candidatus Riflebacteria bacterium]
MSKYKKIWGIFFSLFFLWLALRKINFQAIPEVLSEININYFLLLIISYTLEMVTRAHRWLIIQEKEKLTFKYSFFGLILTFFFNNILPARAGEFFRPYYFAKKDLADSGETLAAVVLERFFDGVMLLTLILISFQNFTSNETLKQASIITAVFYTIVLVGILLAIFSRSLFEKITDYFYGLLPKKIGDFLSNLTHKFIDGLSTIKDFKRLVKIILSSAVCWFCSVITIWLGFKAFGLEDNLVLASFVLTVLSISSMIPASPGNIGVYEYFCVFTFNVLGHSAEKGTAFSIVMHGTQYLYILVLGIIIAIIEGIKVKEFAPSQQTEKA